MHLSLDDCLTSCCLVGQSWKANLLTDFVMCSSKKIINDKRGNNRKIDYRILILGLWCYLWQSRVQADWCQKTFFRHAATFHTDIYSARSSWFLFQLQVKMLESDDLRWIEMRVRADSTYMSRNTPRISSKIKFFWVSLMSFSRYGGMQTMIYFERKVLLHFIVEQNNWISIPFEIIEWSPFQVLIPMWRNNHQL